MTIDISCDECRSAISDGESVYCQDDWDTLIKRIEELESQVEEKDYEISTWEDDLAKADEEIQDLKNQVGKLESENIQLEDRIRRADER